MTSISQVIKAAVAGSKMRLKKSPVIHFARTFWEAFQEIEAI